jgi:hypothetical protein
MEPPFKFELEEFAQKVEVTMGSQVLDDVHEGPGWTKTLDYESLKEILLNFPAFKDWREKLKHELSLQKNSDHPFHEYPYSLKSVKIQSVDLWGASPEEAAGFIKLKAKIENAKGSFLPGIAFLRGGSVAVLMILRPIDNPEERYVILTVQPRIPSGSLVFPEIPAGMLDRESHEIRVKAVEEILDETAMRIPKDELIDMTKLALEDASTKSLRDAMYPSPGGSDEYISLLLWEKELSRMRIMDVRDQLTGNRHQGEMITLKLVKYEDLWKEGAKDGKTLAALALYEALIREGKLENYMSI